MCLGAGASVQSVDPAPPSPRLRRTGSADSLRGSFIRFPLGEMRPKITPLAALWIDAYTWCTFFCAVEPPSAVAPNAERFGAMADRKESSLRIPAPFLSAIASEHIVPEAKAEGAEQAKMTPTGQFHPAH